MLFNLSFGELAVTNEITFVMIFSKNKIKQEYGGYL